MTPKGWMKSYSKWYWDHDNNKWVPPSYDRLKKRIAALAAETSWTDILRYGGTPDKVEKMMGKLNRNWLSQYADPEMEEEGKLRGICAGVTGVWITCAYMGNHLTAPPVVMAKSAQALYSAELIAAKVGGALRGNEIQVYKCLYETIMCSMPFDVTEVGRGIWPAEEKNAETQDQNKMPAYKVARWERITDAVEDGFKQSQAVEITFDCADEKGRTGSHCIGLFRKQGHFSAYVFDANLAMCKYSTMSDFWGDMPSFIKFYSIAGGMEWSVFRVNPAH